jgi:hypothetical protein
MSDSAIPVWAIPPDPEDMAPLPALLRIDHKGEHFALYCRHGKEFGLFEWVHLATFDTFEQCRAAMIEARTEALRETREHARKLAASIEHVRTIPAAPFPDVSREVPEAQQQQQEAEGQEKAPAKEVAPKPLLKRPSRKTQ